MSMSEDLLREEAWVETCQLGLLPVTQQHPANLEDG